MMLSSWQSTSRVHAPDICKCNKTVIYSIVCHERLRDVFRQNARITTQTRLHSAVIYSAEASATVAMETESPASFRRRRR